MRYCYLLLGLFVFVVMLAFSLLNTTSVPLNLVFTKVHYPLLALIWGAWVLGMLVTMLIMLPRQWRLKHALKKQRQVTRSS